MSKKKPARVYDLENGTLTMMNKDGESYCIGFTGLRSDVMLKLAMIGAGSLLCKVDNPLVLWEKIRQNQFGRQRSYKNTPKVVIALARIAGKKIEEMEKEWKAFDKEERGRLKSTPEVKRELLKMQMEELDE